MGYVLTMGLTEEEDVKRLPAVAAILTIAVAVGSCDDTMNPNTQSSKPTPTGSSVPRASSPQIPPAVLIQNPSATSTPPRIIFPTLPADSPDALMIGVGRLAVVDGCFWLISPDGSAQGVVWPYGYAWRDENGAIQILDEQGTVVAQVGDSIVMGGGAGQGLEEMGRCRGADDVWYAAPPIQTEEQAAMPTPIPPPPDIPFPQTAVPSDADQQLIGTLTLSDGCLRVEARTTGESYLIVWPPGVSPRTMGDSIILDDGSHLPDGSLGVAHYRGWPGADLFLLGEAVSKLPEGLALHESLDDCPGPYWIAGAEVQIAEFASLDGQPPRLNRDDSALVAAIQYATSFRVTLAEAVHRLALQDPAGHLNGTLTANHHDAFAGFWAEHEPEFKFVARFTRDGEETIRPYIEGTPLEGYVEVRNDARWTEAELEAQQAEANRILNELTIDHSSATDIIENRVEVTVIDRASVEAALAETGVKLPAAVVLIDSDEQPVATPD